MPDDKVLQVAILIWGCAFCAIAALCMFLSSNYDREKRRYLILMESFASLLLLMDAMAHIFSGYPGVPTSSGGEMNCTSDHICSKKSL